MPVKKLTSVEVPAKIGGVPTKLTLETADNKTVTVTIPNDVIATIGDEHTLTIEVEDLREATNGLTNFGKVLTEAFTKALSNDNDSLFKTNNGLNSGGGIFGDMFGPKSGYRRY